jgi:hypothetical protein
MRPLSIPIFVCTLALVAAPPALARPDTSGRRVDVTGSIVAGGDPVTVTIPSDENALITFAGTANQRVSLALSGVSIWMGWVSIRKPDGSDLVWPTVFFTGGKFVDTVTLPTTGTYTIFVDPYSSYSGSVTLALFNVPADAGGPITAGGDPASATTGTPGQNARFTFSGTQGQRVSVKAAGSNMTAQGAFVSLLKPDGSTLASSYPNLVTNNASRFLDTATLPSTGTYAVLLDFDNESTGTGTATLYDVPADISGSTTPTPEGTSTTVNPATPGQDARFTFSGTAGQRVSLMSTGSGLQPTGKGAFVSILKPDGSTLVTSYPFLLMETVPRFLDATVLPSSGTYTVRIDPWEETTGNATFKVYEVPADVDDPLSIDGDTFTVTTTVPGQDGRLPFVGTAGQQITLLRQDVTILTSIVQILKPDGSVLSSSGAVGTPAGSQSTTLPVTGTYTVRVDGFNEAVGHMNVVIEGGPPDPPVTMTETTDSVTFTNDDGQWTIYKRCVGTNSTNGVGPAYISRYVTPRGKVAVDGIGKAGSGEFVHPDRGGIGLFGYFEARGNPPYVDDDPATGDTAWNVSLRRCGADLEQNGVGVTSWGQPRYGVGATGGYYNQEVMLGDTWEPRMVEVKYRWQFTSYGVHLYAAVIEKCPNGSCGAGAPGFAYIKAPQFVTNINGPLMPEESNSSKPKHISTFERSGKWLGESCDVDDDRNCTHSGYRCDWPLPISSHPERSTGKCYAETRSRVRLDYDETTTRGDCDASGGDCFNIVAGALGVTTGPEPEPLNAATLWQSAAQLGFDYWARVADGRPDPGGLGCELAGSGSDVSSVADWRSRNWEYGVITDSTGRLDKASIGAKAWDGCQNYYDAPAFFRRFGDGAFGVFMSFSLNGGWRTS